MAKSPLYISLDWSHKDVGVACSIGISIVDVEEVESLTHSEFIVSVRRRVLCIVIGSVDVLVLAGPGVEGASTKSGVVDDSRVCSNCCCFLSSDSARLIRFVDS